MTNFIAKSFSVSVANKNYDKIFGKKKRKRTKTQIYWPDLFSTTIVIVALIWSKYHREGWLLYSLSCIPCGIVNYKRKIYFRNLLEGLAFFVGIWRYLG